MKNKLNPKAVYFSTSVRQLNSEIIAERDSKELKTDVPIFREGNFKHRVYGDLEFTRDYLNKIVSNHNNKVVPQDIAFDQDHRPWLGALAWVKDEPGSLYVKDELIEMPDGTTKSMAVLYAKVKYTELGLKKVGGDIFRYFSSEIIPNYSTQEVVNLGEDGDEALISHGPTLIGGGFTNRPFIPGLGGAFNDEDNPLEDESNQEFYGTQNEDGSMYFSVIETEEDAEEPVDIPEPEGIDDEVSVEESDEVEEEPEDQKDYQLNVQSKQIEGEKMKFSELIEGLKSFSTSQERVEYLEQNSDKVSEEFSQAAQTLLEAEQEKIKAARSVENAVAKYSRLEEDNKKLKQENSELSLSVVEAKQKTYESRVKEFAANLKAEGHIDSLVDKTQDLLLSLTPESREMKFNTVDEDGEAFGVVDIVSQIFSEIPEAARLNLSATIDNDVTEVEPEAGQESNQDEPEVEGADETDDLVAKFRENYPTMGFSDEEILKVVDEDGKLDFTKLNQSR